MGSEEQHWHMAIGLSISSVMPNTALTFPCGRIAHKRPMVLTALEFVR